MDKSWMKKSRSSRDYLQGVKGFLKFAFDQLSKDGTILCPCVKCVNSYMLSPKVVHDHLVSFGISQGYNCWYHHGETISAATSSRTCETRVEDMRPEYGDIRDMVHDMFPMHTRATDEVGDERNVLEPFSEGPNVQQPTQEPNEYTKKFYDLLKDADKPLYEGCKNFSKLSAVVYLYHIKCLRGLTNEALTTMQETISVLHDKLQTQGDLIKTQEGEIATLKEQMAFMLRHAHGSTGLQVPTRANGFPDQGSPQARERSSYGSHDVASGDLGNRTI